MYNFDKEALGRLICYTIGIVIGQLVFGVISIQETTLLVLLFLLLDRQNIED